MKRICSFFSERPPIVVFVVQVGADNLALTVVYPNLCCGTLGPFLQKVVNRGDLLSITLA